MVSQVPLFGTWETTDVSRSRRQAIGDWSGVRPRPLVDTLLAATAVQHDLTLVTRNIRDVQGTPVKLLDPWTE